MQEIKIGHDQVLSNLHHFQTFLRDHHQFRDKRKERSYSMWLDSQTGVIEFTKKEGQSISTQKELRLVVHESQEGTAHFKIDGDLSALDASIRAVAEETLKILNLLALVSARTLPEEQALKDLSQVHLEKWNDRIEKFPGWHSSIKRLQAEKLLQNKPIGTYLLRDGDAITELMLKQYPRDLKGYILTVVEEDQKITDYLILKTRKGWTLHQDEPDLRKYDYSPTLQILLEKINHIAIIPYP